MWNKIGLALLSLLLLTASTPSEEIDDLVESGVVPPAAASETRRGAEPAADTVELILPDLHTLPPRDLQLQILPGSGVRRLRFANTIWNSGPGDLDLQASAFPLPSTVRVTQYIPTTADTSVLHEAGVFDFHDEHGHWHWDGFGLYQVLTVDEYGAPGEVVAESDKVGYCLIDVDPYPGAEEVAAPFYTSCIWSRQGITAGWTDTYEAHIGGQYVDISGLPDGLYALRSTVDPDNIIIEQNESNNSSLIFFHLYGETLIVVGEQFPAPTSIHVAE